MAHEIARLLTENYNFRIYGEQQKKGNIISFVGVVIGIPDTDVHFTMSWHTHTFVCDNPEDLYEIAENYITEDLGLNIVAQGGYPDNDWINDLLK